MSTAVINVRINEEDKKNFESLCSELGMNMSTAFSIFVKTMLREQGLPFEVSAKRPNFETLMAIEEAKRITKDPNIKSYTTVKEVMSALEAD